MPNLIPDDTTTLVCDLAESIAADQQISASVADDAHYHPRFGAKVSLIQLNALNEDNEVRRRTSAIRQRFVTASQRACYAQGFH